MFVFKKYQHLFFLKISDNDQSLVRSSAVQCSVVNEIFWNGKFDQKQHLAGRPVRITNLAFGIQEPTKPYLAL